MKMCNELVPLLFDFGYSAAYQRHTGANIKGFGKDCRAVLSKFSPEDRKDAAASIRAGVRSFKFHMAVSMVNGCIGKLTALSKSPDLSQGPRFLAEGMVEVLKEVRKFLMVNGGVK